MNRLALYVFFFALCRIAQAQNAAPPVEPAPPLGTSPAPNVTPPIAPLAPPEIKQPFENQTASPAPDADTAKPPVAPDLPTVSAPVAGTAGPVASGQIPPDGETSITGPEGLTYDAERGLIIGRGPITLRRRNFTVIGDRVVVDYNKNEATLVGNLKVTAGEQEISGRTLTYNLDTGVWVLSNLEKTFPPDFFPDNSVIEPIYVTGEKITGADARVTGQDFRVSSCDRGHYYFLCREVRFYRDENDQPTRIVLRRNALHAFGRRLVPLPVYSINLVGGSSRRVPLQPIVGQNSFDGVFVKSTYSLSSNASRTDTILIDLLQKRGLGLGFNRELAKNAGLFYLYALTGTSGGRQIDARVNRIWQVRRDLTATLNFQSTQNSSAGFSGTSRNADLTFAYNRERVQSNLLFRFNESGSGASNFRDFGATWQHRQTFGALDINAGTVYSTNTFSGGGQAETLDNTVLLNWRQKRMDWFLRAENHDDLTGVNQRNGAYQLERLPEIGFLTDTNRTKIPLLSRYLPGDITMSFGEFNEPSSRQKLFRTVLGYNLRPRVYQLLKRGKFSSELNAAGRFEQAFYSDDTARYNYDMFLNWTNKRGRLTTRVDYVESQFRGYTPFQFDFLFPSKSVDAAISYRIAEKFSLDLTGGQDLKNNIARDTVAQLRFQPTRNFYMTLGANYSREASELGDVVANFHLARPNRKLFSGTTDLGVRYSPQNGSFSRINAATDLFVTRKNRVQALASYNGFAKTFDFTQIRLTRDLHCFNLYLTYDQQRKEMRLDLALKAFPFLDTRFGRNDTGTGFSPFFGQFQ